MRDKKLCFKVFVIGFILIIIQTVFQNMTGFLNILGGLMGYLKPFIWAIFVAILLNPLVELIENKTKLHRGTSIFVSILLVLVTLTCIMFWFIPSLIESFEDIIEKFPAFQNGFNKYLGEVFDFLRKKNLILLNGEEIKNEIEGFFVKNMNNIKDILISFGLNIAGQIMDVFVIFFGAFLGLYLVYDREYFMNFIKNVMFLIFGELDVEERFNFLVESKNIFLDYMLGKILISIIIGVLSYIGLVVSHVPYALIIAVMLGVGNMIPFFGPFIGGLVSLVLVFLSIPVKCIPLLVVMGMGQIVDGYILGPKILEKSVGLSSFWVIVSVLIMGNLLGTIGMFLGVPIFAILRLIYIKVLKKKRTQLQIENNVENN